MSEEKHCCWDGGVRSSINLLPRKITITENCKTQSCKVSGSWPKGMEQIYSKKFTKFQLEQ